MREARASMSIASWTSRDWGSADDGGDPDFNRSAYQQPDPVARRMGSVSIEIRTGAKQSAASRVVSSSTPIVILSHSCRSATTVNYASPAAQSLTIEMDGPQL